MCQTEKNNGFSSFSMPSIEATGAIQPKILQGHCFLTCHPSDKFCPNRFSLQREIDVKTYSKVTIIWV